MNPVGTDRWNQLLSDAFHTMTGAQLEPDPSSHENLVALSGRLLGVGQVASVSLSWAENRDYNGLILELPEEVVLVQLGWNVEILVSITRSCRAVAWAATTGETGMWDRGDGGSIDELKRVALQTYAQQLRRYRTGVGSMYPPFVTVLFAGEDDVLIAWTEGMSLEIRRIKQESSVWTFVEKAAADLQLTFWDHPRYDAKTGRWSDEGYGQN